MAHLDKTQRFIMLRGEQKAVQDMTMTSTSTVQVFRDHLDSACIILDKLVDRFIVLNSDNSDVFNDAKVEERQRQCQMYSSMIMQSFGKLHQTLCQKHDTKLEQNIVHHYTLRLQSIMTRYRAHIQEQEPLSLFSERDGNSGPGSSLTSSLETNGYMQLQDESTQRRSEQIVELSTQIKQLNELFQQMAILVHDQGVVLDRIDIHIENAKSDTMEELRIADERSSNNSKTCVMCFVLLGCILLILVALIISKYH